jgi:hypothetical protein
MMRFSGKADGLQATPRQIAAFPRPSFFFNVYQFETFG